MTRLNLEGAAVVITGHADGYPVTLKGNIKNVDISVERADHTQTFTGNYALSDDSRYFLEFDADNDRGTAYTVEIPTTNVKHTARIEAVDRTVEAIEKARKAVGAPKKARFRLGKPLTSEAVLTVDAPTPIEVEFYWTENVRSTP